ncbi:MULTISPECIES: hypothetical protein [unclassified Pseudomonas]|uniref:hypothetical protein n=1 Tax=unclassified Pseudomonas TaxID=196821 RepID=UPI000A1D9A40|nr:MULTISPECIES: hypothetical protein [unclassified Pseudomonas]
MNSALLLANAIALAVLVGFHFAPREDASVAQRLPHYLMVQKAPQWAVLSDRQVFAPQEVNEPGHALPAQSTERLAF